MDAADPRFIDSSYFLLSQTMMIVGLILGVLGWLWVSYQSYRLAPLHGLLSLVTGIWAVVYGMRWLEHRHKIAGMTVFLVGFMLAGAGYALTYAGWLCDVDDQCNRPMRAEVLDAEAEGFDVQLLSEGSAAEAGAAEEGAAEEGAAEEGAAEAGAAEAGAAEAGAAEAGAAEAGAAEAGAEGEAGSTE